MVLRNWIQFGVLISVLLLGGLVYWGRFKHSGVPPPAGLPHLESSFPNSPQRKPPVRNESAAGKAAFGSGAANSGRPLPFQPALAEKHFPELITKNREMVLTLGYSARSRFQVESTLMLREARLLALACPEIAEKLATPIALDRTRDWRERKYCTDLLGILARDGNPSVRETLRSLLTVENEHIVVTALAGIGMADVNGFEKPLYWAKCREGDGTAFSLVARWPDSGTVSQMNLLLNGPERDEARDVLKKLELLTQPNWSERVTEILNVQCKQQGMEDWKQLRADVDVDWALNVLKRGDPGRLKAVLREHLDEAMQNLRSWWEEGPRTRTYEEIYGSKPDLNRGARNDYYDDMLVTCWELGGELKDLERTRLRTFGYGCDPGERLQELISTGK